MISVHAKTTWKVGVFNFLKFEEIFKKLCFRDGLAWTMSLTVEMNPAKVTGSRVKEESRRATWVDEREKRNFFALAWRLFAAYRNKAAL